MEFSTIRDLSYRLEGYGDIPDYEIKTIKIFDDGNILVYCRRNETEKNEATEQTQDGTADGEQTEPQGAENDSDE